MKNIDDILKQALTPNDEPDFWLNERILSQSKEVKPMKKMTRKKFATVALFCAFMLGIGSVSVYAAWKYLMPNEVIEEMIMEEDKLADAFSEENAIYINETQSYGGYDITLLGITSGKNLTKYKYLTNDTTAAAADASNEDFLNNASKEGLVEQNDRSYILFAVKHKSKDLMSIYDFEEGISIFPVVMGYDYEVYDGMFLNGSGGHEMKKDGVVYCMFECNNLEKFADHDIYMCVSDDIPAFSEYSYIYDNAAGTIARNEEYEGLNALFSLSLDTSKADPEAAAAAVKEYETHLKALENAPEEPEREDIQKAYDFVEQITPENINDYATPLTDEDAIQTFGPADAQGRISIKSFYHGIGSRTKIKVEESFPNGTTEFVIGGGMTDHNLDTMFVQHYKLNEDGTITLQYYAPNFPE